MEEEDEKIAALKRELEKAQRDKAELEAKLAAKEATKKKSSKSRADKEFEELEAKWNDYVALRDVTKIIKEEQVIPGGRRKLNYAKTLTEKAKTLMELAKTWRPYLEELEKRFSTRESYRAIIAKMQEKFIIAQERENRAKTEEERLQYEDERILWQFRLMRYKEYVLAMVERFEPLDIFIDLLAKARTKTITEEEMTNLKNYTIEQLELLVSDGLSYRADMVDPKRKNPKWQQAREEALKLLVFSDGYIQKLLGTIWNVQRNTPVENLPEVAIVLQNLLQTYVRDNDSLPDYKQVAERISIVESTEGNLAFWKQFFDKLDGKSIEVVVEETARERRNRKARERRAAAAKKKQLQEVPPKEKEEMASVPAPPPVVVIDDDEPTSPTVSRPSSPAAMVVVEEEEEEEETPRRFPAPVLRQGNGSIIVIGLARPPQLGVSRGTMGLREWDTSKPICFMTDQPKELVSILTTNSPILENLGIDSSQLLVEKPVQLSRKFLQGSTTSFDVRGGKQTTAELPERPEDASDYGSSEADKPIMRSKGMKYTLSHFKPKRSSQKYASPTSWVTSSWNGGLLFPIEKLEVAGRSLLPLIQSNGQPFSFNSDLSEPRRALILEVTNAKGKRLGEVELIVFDSQLAGYRVAIALFDKDLVAIYVYSTSDLRSPLLPPRKARAFSRSPSPELELPVSRSRSPSPRRGRAVSRSPSLELDLEDDDLPVSRSRSPSPRRGRAVSRSPSPEMELSVSRSRSPSPPSRGRAVSPPRRAEETANERRNRLARERRAREKEQERLERERAFKAERLATDFMDQVFTGKYSLRKRLKKYPAEDAPSVIEQMARITWWLRYEWFQNNERWPTAEELAEGASEGELYQFRVEAFSFPLQRAAAESKKQRINSRLIGCAACSAPAPRSKCSACGQAKYCGQACADAHWKEHNCRK